MPDPIDASKKASNVFCLLTPPGYADRHEFMDTAYMRHETHPASLSNLANDWKQGFVHFLWRPGQFRIEEASSDGINRLKCSKLVSYLRSPSKSGSPHLKGSSEVSTVGLK